MHTADIIINKYTLFIRAIGKLEAVVCLSVCLDFLKGILLPHGETSDLLPGV